MVRQREAPDVDGGRPTVGDVEQDSGLVRGEAQAAVPARRGWQACLTSIGVEQGQLPAALLTDVRQPAIGRRREQRLIRDGVVSDTFGDYCWAARKREAGGVERLPDAEGRDS